MILAKNKEEALSKAADEFFEADFGALEVEDGEPIYVEDAQGNRVWEE